MEEDSRSRKRIGKQSLRETRQFIAHFQSHPFGSKFCQFGSLFFFFKRRRRETNLYVVLLASTLSNLILTAIGGNGVEEKEAALRGAY